MEKRITVTLYFDKRRIKEGFRTVKYSVYFKGIQKEFSAGLLVTEDEAKFLKENEASLSGRIRDERRRQLWHQVYDESYVDSVSGVSKEGVLYRAQRIIAQIESYFTFEIFSQAIKGQFVPENKKVTNNNLIVALEDRGQRFKDQGDIRTGRLCFSTAASLRRYAVYAKLAKNVEKVNLPLQMVTHQELRKYEKWMLRFGRAPKSESGTASPASLTTISIYTRNVRTIINKAINDKVYDEALYPFQRPGKTGYQVPEVENEKKALSVEDMGKIFAYICKPGSRAEIWRDIWLFIYMGNGINPTDLCKLRNADYRVEEQSIEFYRDKTLETKRKNMSKIKIILFPELIAIIEKWRNPDRSPESYLFPFLLKNDLTPHQEVEAINQVTKNINRTMDAISRKLGLGIKVRTYEARHTFATVLTAQNVPIKAIAEMYGHSTTKTTEKYIASIRDRSAQNYIHALVPKIEEQKE